MLWVGEIGPLADKAGVYARQYKIIEMVID